MAAASYLEHLMTYNLTSYNMSSLCFKQSSFSRVDGRGHGTSPIHPTNSAMTANKSQPSSNGSAADLSATGLSRSADADDDFDTDDGDSDTGAAVPKGLCGWRNASCGGGGGSPVVPAQRHATGYSSGRSAGVLAATAVDDDRTPAPAPSSVLSESVACSQSLAAEGTSVDVADAEETLLIFDWDDTVFPSSWLQSQGLNLDTSSGANVLQREQFSKVAETAAEMLHIAKQLGTVVLVTNAERGWIELSCQTFMPKLYPSLESIRILSARTAFESPQNETPVSWKVCAFESVLGQTFRSKLPWEPEARKNILSLGDSSYEREALLRSTTRLPNCRSKSFKFVERPNITQLLKQQSLVTSCLERLVQHDGNLDLVIKVA
jgi:hypothetical protein